MGIPGQTIPPIRLSVDCIPCGNHACDSVRSLPLGDSAIEQLKASVSKIAGTSKYFLCLTYVKFGKNGENEACDSKAHHVLLKSGTQVWKS